MSTFPARRLRRLRGSGAMCALVRETRIEAGRLVQPIFIAGDRHPLLLLITDVCLCSYTSHGHCGVVSGETVRNDVTLPLLAAMAVSHAAAGADVVAPSADAIITYFAVDVAIRLRTAGTTLAAVGTGS